MKNTKSTAFLLQNIKIKDAFWSSRIELIAKEVISYQWEALNDNISGKAVPYYLWGNRKPSEILVWIAPK